MTERITYGYKESSVDTNSAELISVADVKSHLGIDFVSHDDEIASLIPACRIAVEQKYSRSLISKDVSVFWINFFDDITLPYSPLAEIPNLTVSNLDGEEINESDYSVHEVGGMSVFKGDFPDGVKLNYTTKAIDNKDIERRLMGAVGSCLHDGFSIDDAIKKHFQYARI